ncbi:alpha/beta hydrolase [Micromonospora sp. M12]
MLDAGGGEDSSYWSALVPQLSQATGSQIITYDRAGMGASEEVKGPWDPKAAASDLQAGLRELGVTQNVVLAGHSQAGEVAHYFVLANPGVVSGAVLIDANVPQFFTDTQTQRLVALTSPQIEELKKAPSTKANRQLIATADNFGPTHQAYHRSPGPTAFPSATSCRTRRPSMDLRRTLRPGATRQRRSPRRGPTAHSSSPREARTTFPRTSPPWCSGNRTDDRHRQVEAIGPTADRTGEPG